MAVDQAKLEEYAQLCARWLGTLSEAEMAPFMEEEQQWAAADEAKKTAMMQEYKDRFSAADADGDGRVNRAEFTAMKEAERAAETAKGRPVAPAEFQNDDMEFAVLNSASAEDGFTFEEYRGVGEMIEARIGELMGGAAQQ